MQNYAGLIWLFLPLVFVILLALLMILPRTNKRTSKRAFYVLIAVGLFIVGGYYFIRTFIIPP